MCCICNTKFTLLHKDSMVNSNERNRRFIDESVSKRVCRILLESDISMVALIGGLGLILWSVFGLYAYKDNLETYASMFPYGNGYFWASAYAISGCMMWYVAIRNFPPLASLLVGGWTTVFWTWITFARMTTTVTYQTGMATSILYILIGFLIVQRSAK